MTSIHPKTLEEAVKLVRNALCQGDSRYMDSESEKILAHFLVNNAVLLTEKKLSKEKTFIRENIHRVQGYEKEIARSLLKEKGFSEKNIYLEKKYQGFVADVVAEKENFVVIVECCSCNISKIIYYLQEADEVWILTRGETPWEEKPFFEKMQWFIFRKGPCWKETFNKYQIKKIDKLKKIKNPLDII